MGDQGQSGQAIKLFQAPRKIRLTFNFCHKFFILDDVKLVTVIRQQFWMKECWHLLGGVKHTLTPPKYLQGSSPQNLRHCLCLKEWTYPQTRVTSRGIILVSGAHRRYNSKLNHSAGALDKSGGIILRFSTEITVCLGNRISVPW